MDEVGSKREQTNKRIKLQFMHKSAVITRADAGIGRCPGIHDDAMNHVKYRRDIGQTVGTPIMPSPYQHHISATRPHSSDEKGKRITRFRLCGARCGFHYSPFAIRACVVATERARYNTVTGVVTQIVVHEEWEGMMGDIGC